MRLAPGRYFSTNQSSEGRYYPFLDGLRAVGIIWVLSHHVDVFFDLTAIIPPSLSFLFGFFKVGYLGVDIFFVISGFLIAGLLIGGLDGPVRIRRFYVSRFFRIAPQYFLVLFVGLIILKGIKPFQFHHPIRDFSIDGKRVEGLVRFVSHDPRAALVPYFLFLQNYIKPVIPIFGHLWALAVEWHFYLIYPLLVRLSCLLNRDKTGRRRSLVLIIACLVLLCNYFRWSVVAHLQRTPFQTTFFRMDALLFGCLLRLFEGPLAKAARQLGHKLSVPLTLAGTAIFTWFGVYGFNQWQWHSFTLAYVATGCLIVSGLHQGALLNKVLTWRAFLFLGKQSYGIYLWHYLLVFPFIVFVAQLIPVGIVAIFILVSVTVGTVMTQTYEKYFLDLRARLIPKMFPEKRP